MAMNMSAPADDLEALCTDNVAQLDRVDQLLAGLSPAQYTRTQAGADPIGKHVRHMLEHYDSLLRGLEGAIDYETRAREEELEHSPAAARDRIRLIRGRMIDLPAEGYTRNTWIRYTPQAEGHDERWIGSTLEREIHFVLSHTVHHMALIALLAHHAGENVDPAFGVAGSTLRYRTAEAAE